MKACDLLEAELAIDRLEAHLAAELPAHVRAFARAYAAGAPLPPAPAVDRAALGMLEIAHAHPLLAERALALARLAIPQVIEDDPRVAAARAACADWSGYHALVGARDAASRERFGRPFLDLVQRLHGLVLGARMPAAGTCEALAPWHEPDGLVVELAAVRDRWRSLAAAHGVALEPALLGSTARPRAFVVEPRREVILVIPARIATPYARFAVLHELGHALVAALAPTGTARVIDEAVASWVARAMEDPADPWHSPHAAEARARRTSLAIELAVVETGRVLPQLGVIRGHDATSDSPWFLPPALLHDAGAQATYVAAEALADEIGPDDFGGWLASARHHVDGVSGL